MSVSRLQWAAVVAVFGLYMVWLSHHVGAVAGGSDSSGYFNHARLIETGASSARMREVQPAAGERLPQALFIPLGFVRLEDGGHLAPYYPAGLPLFLCAFASLFGWSHAGYVTMIVHAALGLLATYGLGRMVGLDRTWSLLGAGILATCPLYVFMSLIALSDVPSLVWTCAAILAALKGAKNASWAAAAGVALSIDVLLRPANLLALVPVSVVLGLSPRRWAFLAVGGLPAAWFCLSHNESLYGRPFATGYGDMSALFTTSNLPAGLSHYALWLPILLTPLVLFAVRLPWLTQVPMRIRMALGAWIVSYGAFYAPYHFTHEMWWFLRFLLPAFPGLIVAALLAVRDATKGFLNMRVRALAIGIPAALGLLAAANGAWWIRDLYVLDVGDTEKRYLAVCRWLEANIPSDAVCVAMQMSGSIFYYTPFPIVRWDHLDERSLPCLERTVREQNLPLYAVLFPHEQAESRVLDKCIPGHWVEVGRIDTVSVWRREFDTSLVLLDAMPVEACVRIEGPAHLRVNGATRKRVWATYGPENWWHPENDGVNYWRWSRGDASVVINNPNGFPVRADISFILSTVEPRSAAVTVGQGRRVELGRIVPSADNRARIPDALLPPGDTVIVFHTDRPPVYPGPADRRLMAFAVRDLRINLKER